MVCREKGDIKISGFVSIFFASPDLHCTCIRIRIRIPTGDTEIDAEEGTWNILYEKYISVRSAMFSPGMDFERFL